MGLSPATMNLFTNKIELIWDDPKNLQLFKKVELMNKDWDFPSLDHIYPVKFRMK